MKRSRRRKTEEWSIQQLYQDGVNKNKRLNIKNRRISKSRRNKPKNEVESRMCKARIGHDRPKVRVGMNGRDENKGDRSREGRGRWTTDG